MGNLSDIREKKTPITIGGKTKHLHYDLNAFAELEEIYGSVEKITEELQKGSIKAVINVLWAGLIHEDKTLTRHDVGKMFDLSGLQTVGELINQALTQAMPKPSEKETDLKKK